MSYEYNELNKRIISFMDTGVHRYNNGKDIVSRTGIKQINAMLMQVGLPVIPANYPQEVLAQSLQSVGANPLSLGENFVTANGGDLTSLDKTGTTLQQRLGIIQRETSTPAEAVHFDITRDLDWPNGGTTFRDGSSCWWSSSSGSNRYRDSVSLGTEYGNGFAIRLFEPMNDLPSKMSGRISGKNYWYDGAYADRGRIWVIPVQYGYVLFNWYDKLDQYRDAQFAELLCNLLRDTEDDDEGTTWVHKSVGLSGANNMYINSGNCEYVYHNKDKNNVPSHVYLNQMIPEMTRTIGCAQCCTRFPKSFWSEDSHGNYRKAKCQDCIDAEQERVVEAASFAETELRVAVNETVNTQTTSGRYDGIIDSHRCIMTRNWGDTSDMINLNGVERITESGAPTNATYGTTDWIKVSVFNYYFQWDVDDDGNPMIRRRLARETNIGRVGLSGVIYGEVGRLKKIYGRFAGNIQRGLTVNPAKANTEYYRWYTINQIKMRLCKANQLWNNLDWVERL